jgi:chemotaxis signal transduction protein
MDDRTRSQLAERSRRVAQPATAKSASREVGRFVGFRVQDTLFGVPVSMVHEFARLTHWVPLAGAPHVLGVAQLRGEAIALVDLLGALTGRPCEIGDWIVVLQGRGGRVAAPVSEVRETRLVLESDLAPRDQLSAPSPAATAVTNDLWWLLEGPALGAALDPEAAAGRALGPEPRPAGSH